ncbi:MULTISPECIES: FecR domain-containing protein [unclassified Polynucleobacter]|uniref:FecR domain-containing protein n=1 Tax=unclassified Polynucleobacter TaxID=2640945 RepID=UPI0013724AB0|nr:MULTISPECIES: FecR domain-containing protein [unclassified Polynucleobacter]
MVTAIGLCKPFLKSNSLAVPTENFLVLLRIFVSTGIFAWSTFIVAQPTAHSEPKPLVYKVQQGDTLQLILDRHLIQDALPELIAANVGINKNEILAGQTIFIPRSLIRYHRSRAVVVYAKCAEPILRANEAVALKLGSTIDQGDVITVPPQCALSLQFEDRSILRMPSGGSIKIGMLRKSTLEKSPEVQLNLLDGRVEVKVPKRQSGDAPFGVNTPTSVAGVRGTEFRVGFDRSSGAGKVEVSSGLVGTRGVADIEEAGVSAQKGVVIPKDGLADKVEDLPTPVKFLSVQAQQVLGWHLFVFQGSSNSHRYYLRESQAANLVSEEDSVQRKEPLFLATQLGSTAKMLTWSAQTASGLMGDESVFGICVDQSGGADIKRCSVLFDLTGLREPVITLVEAAPNGQAVEILKAYKPSRELKVLLVKGLPVGNYRWEIKSSVGNNLSTRQDGRFELIAATQN